MEHKERCVKVKYDLEGERQGCEQYITVYIDEERSLRLTRKEHGSLKSLLNGVKLEGEEQDNG